MSTIYCDKCDEFVEYNIIEKEEERNIMGKDKQQSLSNRLIKLLPQVF